ncbi:MAG: winged helix-turn-helix domain-containing protein [Rubrivivax sp.]|nr:winged helix-turn-helix domain-containing protein [Rubrivivax sp.]
MQLSVDGQPVPAEPRPLRVLLELLRHAGEVVTREELIETVWDGRETVDNVLANAIAKLRRALGDEAGARVLNVPRIGYRLSGSVERQAINVPHSGAITLASGEPVPGRPSFVLERPLGADGRQNVWLARQPRAGQQRVFKFAVDADGLRSLKREFTLHRLLRHELGARPDMVTLQDANFSESPFYIEMDDAGVDLAAWAQQPHGSSTRLAAMARGPRLALMMDVLRAVAAAHSVGVLHKDIKPGNVLLRAAEGTPTGWQVCLADFGSGRALDPSRVSELGVTALGLTVSHLLSAESLRGTPLYLAPEALAGKAATAQSDVYSLGVMLYQLLAGDLRRPLASGWQVDVDDELLREDIEAATQGDPQRRLQSVAEMLARLSTLESRWAQRQASERQQEADLASAEVERRRRARRPWLMALFVSLVLGLCVAAVLGQRARTSQHEAESAAHRAEQMMQFLADDLLSGVAVERMGPGGTVPMKTVLEQSLLQAGQRFQNQPLILAELRMRLALTYNRIYLLDAALGEAQQALSLLQAASGQAEARALMPQAHLTLAYVHLGKRQVPPAEEQLAQALAAWRALGHGAASSPDEINDALGRRFLETRFRIAGLRGQLPQALELGQQLVRMVDEGAPNDLPQRWAAQMRLAETEFFSGQLEQAENRFGALRQAPFDSEALGPVQRARATVQWARTRVLRGHVDGVEAPAEAARQVLLQHAGPVDNFAAMALETVARVSVRQGDFDRAEGRYRELVNALQAHKPAGDPQTRVGRVMLGAVLVHKGRAADGLALIEPERDWLAALPSGPTAPAVQAFDFERARALNALGKPDKALALLESLQATQLQQAAPDRDWPFRLDAERARSHLLLGQTERGQGLLVKALAGMEKQQSPAWLLESYRKLLKPANGR